ncbi:hypothetical protein ACJMK2_020550 [Sinanodonta woodiana]|uniref:PIR Superfamily Protein n=1 Tax=Sinanodonta woodiana TaxID=1069815 RepID=A0ABD3TZG9_SINWO
MRLFGNTRFGVLVDLRPLSDPCYDADKELNDCLSIFPKEKDSQNFLPDDSFISSVCSHNLLDSVSKCMESNIQWNCAEFYYWKSIKNKYAYICKSQTDFEETKFYHSEMEKYLINNATCGRKIEERKKKTHLKWKL